MRVIVSVVLTLGLVFSLEASCQRKFEVDKNWLSKEFSKRSNLLILNKEGFESWVHIIDDYDPSSLILGYYIHDSLFIYNADRCRTNESCMGVTDGRLNTFADSVLPFCQYAKMQFFKDQYFWQRKPGKPEAATMIVLYSRHYGMTHRKFIRKVEEYSLKTGRPYVLLFADYAVE